MKSGITKKPFGIFEDKAITSYTLTNENGMQVEMINYGATLTKIITPDKDGKPGNVILGFDTLEGYLQNGHQYFGSIIGRYCNRIANAGFSLNEKEYHLFPNDHHASLHGGKKGFDKVCWDVHIPDDDCSIKFTYLSKDGEEGYPGNLFVELIYKLTSDNELILEYSCHTDKPTPVNLTSHCYFNLSGGNEPTILEHELTLFADQFTTLFQEPVSNMPILPLTNSPLDFNIPKKIGKDIHKLPNGYDHNLVLKKLNNIAAELYHPQSGRCMVMFTTEPGLQFYTGNFLDKTVANENDRTKFIKHAALCLEAQHYPNSPNEPLFPNTILKPGELYRQTTVYKFSVR